ncbi:MAG: ComEC/Rec2 family competence protein, partial [Leptolyngbyaceae bacterium]|nr:ComEC/Rec2 family competence protein [Leptolyngbyaceae bacterium]
PKRLWLGSLTLLGYVSLTGLQPSVCRAALLGLAVLVAAVQERKIKPVGALVMIAAVLLLWNPQWIFDLGFQLSFLATLGLVVTVPWLNQKLDGLPPAIAGAIAVPIAALIWTLPILLRTMGTILPYSPLLNVVTTPLIILISLVGMVTGAIAILSPTLGSALASLLYWPIHGLLAMIAGFNQLPGQAIALGTISILQLGLIYSLYGFILWAGSTQTTLPQLHRPMWRWSASLALLTLLAVPIGYGRFHTVKITCLLPSQDHHTTPLMVVQNRGRVGLINTGSDTDIQYKLLPFLRYEGINRIDWAIATTPADASKTPWYQLAHTIPISGVYPLSPPTGETANSSLPASETTPLTSVPPATLPIFPGIPPQPLLGPQAALTLSSTTPPVIQLTLDNQVWLIISEGQAQLSANGNTNNGENPNVPIDVTTFPPSDIWYWPGLAIAPDQVPQLAPYAPRQGVITNITPDRPLSVTFPPVYVTTSQTAVQWHGTKGIIMATEPIDNAAQF